MRDNGNVDKQIFESKFRNGGRLEYRLLIAKKCIEILVGCVIILV